MEEILQIFCLKHLADSPVDVGLLSFDQLLHVIPNRLHEVEIKTLWEQHCHFQES